LVEFYDATRGVATLADYFDQRDGDEAFLLAYAGELAVYLNLAAVMKQAAGSAHYETVLSEPNESVGLHEGMFDELKNAFNLQPWDRPLALYHLRHEALLDDYEDTGVAERQRWAIEYIEDHDSEMVAHGMTTSPGSFAKDTLSRMTRGISWVWFPAQKGVAEALGDTRVVAADRRMISDAQIEEATKRMKPGDLIVERRNWYLSNIGLPGFWPHTALYVGDVDEVRSQLGNRFIDELQRAYPAAVKTWRQADAEGHAMRILEAVSEGVVFNSAPHSLGADYAAAIRPRLDDDQRRAFLRASFEHFGKPYDFDFDFRTDDTIVCSELVYKALESSAPRTTQGIEMESILGRPVLSPNRLVAFVDEHLGDERPPFEFVFYLEGIEQERRAYFRDVSSFRKSHRRPKWDVLQP
jgi:hypothetical protein